MRRYRENRNVNAAAVNSPKLILQTPAQLPMVANNNSAGQRGIFSAKAVANAASKLKGKIVAARKLNDVNPA